jgi:hypothetical protein
MPRFGIRFLGIGLAFLVTGCAAINEANAPVPTSPPVTPTPSAAAAWIENLAFSGDVSGQLTSIVASGPGQVSECTGRNSSTGGRWDSAIYGQVGQAGQVAQAILGVVVTATPYRGPGTYSPPAVTVQVLSTDNQKVWRSQGSDAVTFVIGADERSGSLDAVLTNQLDNTSKLHVSGTWSCGR